MYNIKIDGEKPSFFVGMYVLPLKAVTGFTI